MTTRYYIAHPDDSSPAIYSVDDGNLGEYLAHTVPDWEEIELNPARVWSTTNKSEAFDVAKRYAHFGTRVIPYRAKR
jgi:hypothetical protein